MKKLICLLLLIGNIWSQCDANDDGALNVLDIIEQVNCILDDCWENPEIYGYWMADFINIEITIPGYDTQTQTQYCGQYMDDYEQADALVINFNEDGEGAEWGIDPSFCGLNEVDLSNPSFFNSWSYNIDGNTLILNFIDEYGYEDSSEFSVENIDLNSLVLYAFVVDGNGTTIEVTYDFHRVTPINFGETILDLNNKVSPLNYKKYFKTINEISD